MINLRLQIISLMISFLFGFIFSIFLLFNEKIIYSKFIVIKLFSSFIIVFFSFIIYFCLLQIIDDSFFHIYHLIMIIFGFIVNRSIFKIVKFGKK